MPRSFAKPAVAGAQCWQRRRGPGTARCRTSSSRHQGPAGTPGTRRRRASV